MDEYPEMAKNFIPRTTQGRQTKNKLWADLAGKLNAIALPNKSIPAWRKVWIDFKYRAKRKCSQNLLSIKKKTGGVPSDQIPITKLEEKAIQMASLRSAVTGSSSNCYGAIKVNDPVPEDDNCERDEDEDELENVLCGITESPKKAVEEVTELDERKIQPHATTSTPKRVRREVPKLNMLKTQVETDDNFQSGVLELLEQCNKEKQTFTS